MYSLVLQKGGYKTFLLKYTQSEPKRLWIPSMHSTFWTVPVADKRAPECTDRPCDRSWQKACYKSAQRTNVIGRCRSHTCESNCWSICHTAWKVSLRQGKELWAVWGAENRGRFCQGVCVCVCVSSPGLNVFWGLVEVRCVVVVWVNKWSLESAGQLQLVQHESSS